MIRWSTLKVFWAQVICKGNSSNTYLQSKLPNLDLLIIYFASITQFNSLFKTFSFIILSNSTNYSTYIYISFTVRTISNFMHPFFNRSSTFTPYKLFIYYWESKELLPFSIIVSRSSFRPLLYLVSIFDWFWGVDKCLGDFGDFGFEWYYSYVIMLFNNGTSSPKFYVTA